MTVYRCYNKYQGMGGGATAGSQPWILVTIFERLSDSFSLLDCCLPAVYLYLLLVYLLTRLFTSICWHGTCGKQHVAVDYPKFQFAVTGF